MEVERDQKTFERAERMQGARIQSEENAESRRRFSKQRSTRRQTQREEG